MELNNLKNKVAYYQAIVKNTRAYREAWANGLEDFITKTLTEVAKEINLEAKVTTKSDFENLEAIVFSLGDVKSGMYQEVNDNIKRHLIKHNGSLVYQQLFNGKIMVIINLPFIENYGEPQPPKTLAIYRPEEIQEPFLIRHIEELISALTAWEDYDDDKPTPNTGQRIGFNMNFPDPDPEVEG